MDDPLLQRILQAVELPNLLDVLAEELTPTDLQSLLLAVYRRRAARVRAAMLLAQHEQNRFVRPAVLDPRTLLAFDQLAYQEAAPPFTPIELAPVTPLGANSVVALVDQNKAVATSRNTEVVSDSTNVLALECAVRRRAYLRTAGQEHTSVRLCTSHRLLRAQAYGDPAALAHFRLFALCTAGRDLGGFQFELAALREQITVYLRLLAAAAGAGYRITHLRVAITDLSEGSRLPALRAMVVDPIAGAYAAAVEAGLPAASAATAGRPGGGPNPWPTLAVDFDPHRREGRNYYTDACFHVFARDSTGHEYQVGDGGFTTWTQQLLSNAKERLLSSGLGSERICALFAP